MPGIAPEPWLERGLGTAEDTDPPEYMLAARAKVRHMNLPRARTFGYEG